MFPDYMIPDYSGYFQTILNVYELFKILLTIMDFRAILAAICQTVLDVSGLFLMFLDVMDYSVYFRTDSGVSTLFWTILDMSRLFQTCLVNPDANKIKLSVKPTVLLCFHFYALAIDIS